MSPKPNKIRAPGGCPSSFAGFGWGLGGELPHVFLTLRCPICRSIVSSIVPMCRSLRLAQHCSGPGPVPGPAPPVLEPSSPWAWGWPMNASGPGLGLALGLGLGLALCLLCLLWPWPGPVGAAWVGFAYTAASLLRSSSFAMPPYHVGIIGFRPLAFPC